MKSLHEMNERNEMKLKQVGEMRIGQVKELK